MSWYDWLLVALLAAWIAGSAVWMYRRKKKGRCLGCSGDCESCAYKDMK